MLHYINIDVYIKRFILNDADDQMNSLKGVC